MIPIQEQDICLIEGLDHHRYLNRLIYKLLKNIKHKVNNQVQPQISKEWHLLEPSLNEIIRNLFKTVGLKLHKEIHNQCYFSHQLNQHNNSTVKDLKY